MKRYAALFTVFLALASCAKQSEWIPFEWQPVALPGRNSDKAILHIPVAIESLPYRFVMQLDTACGRTVLYEKTLQPFVEMHPELRDRIDSQFGRYVTVDLRLGGTTFKKTNVAIMKNYGDRLSKSLIDASREIRIGTIGADFFAGRILVIDYPGKRLLVAKALPGEFSRAEFQPMRLKKGAPVLSFSIGGSKENVLFDTGSSTFPLITTERRAAEISEDAVAESFDALGWGVTHSFVGKKMKAPVSFGTREFAPALVYYVARHEFDPLYDDLGVWGLAGNYYFWDGVVILDFRNKLFGVMP